MSSKMKSILMMAFLLLCGANFAQSESINLNNALIVAQCDKENDRYNLEVALTEFFSEQGIKAIPSLNILKQGADIENLASDSLMQIVKAKGIDTYILCNIRGYDRRFKETGKKDDFKTALGYGTLFTLYRDEIVSVTFEFFIYREGQLVKTDLVKCGNISSTETVIKRLKKKLKKRIKKW